jgi:hypothetical protein
MLFTPLGAGDAHLRGEGQGGFSYFFSSSFLFCFTLMSSVADPDPEPDPHILGRPDPDPLVHAVHPLGVGGAHLRGEGQASLTFPPLFSYHVVLFYPSEQCCRSGTGSANFGLPDPDPLVHAVHPLGTGDAHLRGEGQGGFSYFFSSSFLFCFTLMSSVADPDPEPDPDPHILGLPDPDPLVHAVHPL